MERASHDSLAPVFESSPDGVDGSAFRAETDIVPMTVEGHTIAYDFVRAVG